MERIVKLVWPAEEYLPQYVAALERGWSPNNLRPVAAAEELAQIAADGAAFLASLVDRHPRGKTVTMPDGSTVPRLPGYRKWMWDGEFCGSISFRWQHGTEALPPYCLGHIGYGVVPERRRQGYGYEAAAGLRDWAFGQPGVERMTGDCWSDNIASARILEKLGMRSVGTLDSGLQLWQMERPS